MDPAHDAPSLMDDGDFIAELEKLEGRAPEGAADRPRAVALGRADHAPEAFTAPELDDTLELLSETGEYAPPVDGAAGPSDDDEAADDARENRLPHVPLIAAFLTILVGLSAGAAASVLLLHQRVSWLLAFWSR